MVCACADGVVMSSNQQQQAHHRIAGGEPRATGQTPRRGWGKQQAPDERFRHATLRPRKQAQQEMRHHGTGRWTVGRLRSKSIFGILTTISFNISYYTTARRRADTAHLATTVISSRASHHTNAKATVGLISSALSRLLSRRRVGQAARRPRHRASSRGCRTKRSRRSRRMARADASASPRIVQSTSAGRWTTVP